MDGLLVMDKPEGWTSHDVVARARRLLREKRIGHTGTLDPFATGVLVLLVGRATRLAQFLSGAEKEYEATIRLGYSTDTGDLTGARLAGGGADCASLTRERLEAALSSLRGEIDQVPPMYSAKKVGGKKLYELARRGEEIERKAVRVRVSEFEMVAVGGDAFMLPGPEGSCDLRARVVCSAGTYVRSLAESVGGLLGTGAHLAALRRTRAGSFTIDAAVTPEGLQKRIEDGTPAGEFLTPLEAALPEMPAAHLTAEDERKVRHGAAVPAPAAWPEGFHVRLLDERGSLLAVAVYDSERGRLLPRVMLAAEK
ncbi:MAG TPA: tRNA pseudouridine(55) synthase TruB [Pyrinomonadaceae bacterium]|jgi:tRNA pseudouridine55 synthase|nr:tRNA pseudouridine(55) synthase TruB [Pyrinomonadaceae bacterium]